MRTELIRCLPSPHPTRVGLLGTCLTILLVSASSGMAGPLLAPALDRPAAGERAALAASFASAYNELGDDRVVTAGLGVKTAKISSFTLRSYEAKTGALISEDEFDLTVDSETAEALAQGGGRVYAVGSGLTSAGKLSLLVRAYDARTGELLWEDELNPAINPRYRTSGPLTSAGRAWLAAEPKRPESHSSFTVQSINKESGKLLWQDEFLASDPRETSTAPAPPSDSQAFIDQDFSLVVRTYDEVSNRLLWEDQFHPETAAAPSRDDEADFLPPTEQESLDVVTYPDPRTNART